MTNSVERLLARFQADGAVLHLWWRDDDATQPTEELSRLCDMLHGQRVPGHFAVIPAEGPQGSEPIEALAEFLASFPGASVLQHGYRHENRAPAGDKKSEFGETRDQAGAIADIGRGWAKLRRLFGAAALPVFVPPWNRISPNLAASLVRSARWALSTHAANIAETSGEKGTPPIINTHIDLVDWRAPGGPRAIGLEAIADQLATLRDGGAPVGRVAARPLGLLSHHKVMDADAWNITESLLAAFSASHVVRWIRPFEAFAATQASNPSEPEAPA